MTPLLRFLSGIAAIEGRREQTNCIGAVEALGALHVSQQDTLADLDTRVTGLLHAVGSPDFARWIADTFRSYAGVLKELARVVEQTRELPTIRNHFMAVDPWNNRLREVLLRAITTLDDRPSLPRARTLTAFSSAVDAVYDLSIAHSFDALVEHAAEFLISEKTFEALTKDELLERAYKMYQKDPSLDRALVSTVLEVIAEILYALEHPGSNLKPTIARDSEAERWLRRFYIESKAGHSDIWTHVAGGASSNIGDVLAGVLCETDVFWPYHSSRLAGSVTGCSGAHPPNRCWFDDEWNWQSRPFSEAGGVSDQTRRNHPTRLSLVLPFSPEAPVVEIRGIPIGSTKFGRVILQFKDYRSDEYFDQAEAGTERWTAAPRFCRWRWSSQRDEEVIDDVGPAAMDRVRRRAYQRVILSAFQRADAGTIRTLGEQCEGMPLHHEISASFESAKETYAYCDALRLVFAKTARRSAGVNGDELAAFTSWQGTDVFAGARPAVRDSYLQCMFRAMTVRKEFDLDWLYVHGNDIDITVLAPGKDQAYVERLRDAMLFAKVTVFAALHVRSGFTNLPPSFEPSCSPKGLVALYQFAEEFARQYGRSDGDRTSFRERLVVNGFVCGQPNVPDVLAVPVYWPDPLPGCSTTGAGDISSGVTAAFAP